MSFGSGPWEPWGWAAQPGELPDEVSIYLVPAVCGSEDGGLGGTQLLTFLLALVFLLDSENTSTPFPGTQSLAQIRLLLPGDLQGPRAETQEGQMGSILRQ